MIPAQIETLIKSKVAVVGDRVNILNESAVRSQLIDDLVRLAVFGDSAHKPAARWLIWEIAQELGIRPNSIHPLYMARGRGIIPAVFTVPAMNFRGLVYDTARALFETAVATDTTAFICELARGEMAYSDQSPAEYTTVLLAGAIKAGYVGPVFVQGDHFQTSCHQPGEPDPGEIEAIALLIQEALAAGFYNIDIDASTLVMLKEELVADQQRPNIHYTAELARLIRSLEPAGMTVSVGGEIGHIGGKNSTLEDFTEFMNGLTRALDGPVISKISVATGTSHGGVVNPDGSLAEVAVDFSVLKDISDLARAKYQIGGAVQHGASTLPDTMLHQFPPTGTIEIHLATAFQNLIMDHPAFPQELLSDMYAWLDQNKQAEKEKGWTS
jgi:fructose/tagatose bisphosphate aldolase